MIRLLLPLARGNRQKFSKAHLPAGGGLRKNRRRTPKQCICDEIPWSVKAAKVAGMYRELVDGKTPGRDGGS
jgi:hypothetical protein